MQHHRIALGSLTLKKGMALDKSVITTEYGFEHFSIEQLLSFTIFRDAGSREKAFWKYMCIVYAKRMSSHRIGIHNSNMRNTDPPMEWLRECFFGFCQPRIREKKVLVLRLLEEFARGDHPFRPSNEFYKTVIFCNLVAHDVDTIPNHLRGFYWELLVFCTTPIGKYQDFKQQLYWRETTASRCSFYWKTKFILNDVVREMPSDIRNMHNRFRRELRAGCCADHADIDTESEDSSSDSDSDSDSSA